MNMRKITLTGIFIMLFGIFLVSYAVTQSDGIILEYDYLIMRAILILGFVMMMGGALISLSPFSRK
jgi:hypothetical protein